MLAKQLAPKATREVTPHRMDVIAVVLRVVVLNQERRSLHARVGPLAALELARL